MQMITFCVFLPLTLLLMAVAFSDKLRSRVLAAEPVRSMEEKLHISGRMYWLLFVLIMAAGVFSRCWRFLELPLGYNQDGLMIGVEAYCLAMGGVDQLGTSWPTYFEAWGFAHMSPLYAWVMIPFMKVLGSTRLALRLPMLLFSLAMLPVIWDFARRMFGKNFALLALFVIAINPWHVLQSRWAIDCNIMPHFLMIACYLLLLGRKSRAMLYLSMVFFALSIYGYGLACFSVPVILLCMAAYYVARKKANILDILVCVVIFVGLAGPFFYTMAINAFGLEGVQIGPITLPFFAESKRTNDMPFFRLNPYAAILYNLIGFLYATVIGGFAENYYAMDLTHVMYRFMSPVIVYAVYRMWRDERGMALRKEDHAARDGMMIVLSWMLGSLVNGLLIGGGVNRNDVVYYALIMVCAYGLYLLAKRFKTGFVLTVVMLVVSFVSMNVTYFTDEAYQNSYRVFHNGLVEALEDTWDWDYDEVYVSEASGGSVLAEAAILYAHDIDYAGRSDQRELLNSKGEPTGWYFSERYKVVQFDSFELDPEACSVYIIAQSEKGYFDEELYLLTDYGDYAAAYPRYWAE